MVDTLFSILRKKKIVHLLYFALAVFTSSGCALNKTLSGQSPPPEILNDLNKSITTLYPDRFKALHHVILTFSGKDYVLDGYLFIDRPGRKINLIAQNDFGGIFFEIQYIKNVEKTIHINVNMLKEKWLEKSVLRDIETLYLMEPFPSPVVLYDVHKNLVLSQNKGQITQELRYSKIDTFAPYRLYEIRHLTDNKCFYTINLQYGTDSANPYPEFIIIKDTKLNYTLQINIRYFM